MDSPLQHHTRQSSVSSITSDASHKPIIGDTLCPPPLSYSLHDRKLAVAICWFVIVLDSTLLAVGLYYPLVYATNLSLTDVMTIVTCLVGIISLAEFGWRTWLLVRDDASKRPINGGRWQLDAFHWIYIVSIIIVTMELVAGTDFSDPIISLCSMPLASILFIAAAADLLATTCYFLQIRLPIRVSSVAKGEICRPGSYTAIEDVIAVDSGGDLEFRIALDRRYRASPEFRRMLAVLSLCWSIPALIVGGGVTAAVWLTSEPVAFGIGWVVPMIWLTIWAVLTVPVCKYMLGHEREAWLKRSLAA